MCSWKSYAVGLIAGTLITAAAPAHFSIAPANAQSGQPGLATIAVEGDPAPAEVGGTFAKVESCSLGESGEVAFTAELSGSSVTSALFLNSGGTNRVILRSGDGTPAGGTFTGFHEVDAADGDFILFRATLGGITPAEGVFLWYSQTGVQTIQLAGDQTNNRYPGMTYKSFSQLSVMAEDSTSQFGVNYAFVATLNEGGEVIVWNQLNSKSPGLDEEITGQDSFEAESPREVVDHFVISRLGNLGLIFVAQYHRRHGNKEFDRPFYSQSTLRDDPTLTEGLKTSLGKLQQMDVPVAVDYDAQIFFSAALVKNGQSSRAILTESIQGFSPFPLAALLVTGDEAPGHRDQTIVDIGPPVANPVRNPPRIRLPSALASEVQLSDGEKAIWVAILTPGTNGAEFTINARLELLGGATGDPIHQLLTSMRPVKLTDTGKLLISGSVGDGGSARNGLFLLDGLF